MLTQTHSHSAFKFPFFVLGSISQHYIVDKMHYTHTRTYVIVIQIVLILENSKSEMKFIM